MKKIISISLALTLIATAVFAEPTVSGAVYGYVIPIAGDSGKDENDDPNKLQAGGELTRARLDFAAENESGDFGAWLRVKSAGFDLEKLDFDLTDGISDNGIFNSGISGNIWWQPMKQLKFLIGGSGGSGFFYADGGTFWGFYDTDADVGVVKEAEAFGRSFYDGWYGNGATLSITPIDALAINVAIPFIDKAGDAENLYPYTHVQAAYTLDKLGFILTFVGGKNEYNEDAYTPPPATPDPDYDLWEAVREAYQDAAKLYAYFNFAPNDDLSLDLGLGFTFPVTSDDGTYNAPVAVGVGGSFKTGDIGIKARIQGEFGELFKPDGGGDDVKGPFVLTADLLPSYNINENIKALLSAGLVLTAFDSDDKDSNGDAKDATVGWHIEPYIIVKSIFYAGFRIESNGVKDADDNIIVKWSVPIGLAFSF